MWKKTYITTTNLSGQRCVALEKCDATGERCVALEKCDATGERCVALEKCDATGANAEYSNGLSQAVMRNP
jgi:hypothetical protein